MTQKYVLVNTFLEEKTEFRLPITIKLCVLVHAALGFDRLDIITDLQSWIKYLLRTQSALIILAFGVASLNYIAFSDVPNSKSVSRTEVAINLLCIYTNFVFTRKTKREYTRHFLKIMKLKNNVKVPKNWEYLVAISKALSFSVGLAYVVVTYRLGYRKWTGYYYFYIVIRFSEVFEVHLITHALLKIRCQLNYIILSLNTIRVQSQIPNIDILIYTFANPEFKHCNLATMFMAYREAGRAMNNMKKAFGANYIIVIVSVLVQLIRLNLVVKTGTKVGLITVVEFFGISLHLFQRNLTPSLVQGNILKQANRIRKEIIRSCCKNTEKTSFKLLKNFGKLTSEYDFSMTLGGVVKVDTSLSFTLLAQLVPYVVIILQLHKVTLDL